MLKKREIAMNDPTNALYGLRSNYYQNNYGQALVAEGESEIFKLKHFPLNKLLNEMPPQMEHEGGDIVKIDVLKSDRFKLIPRIKEEKKQTNLPEPV